MGFVSISWKKMPTVWYSKETNYPYKQEVADAIF